MVARVAIDLALDRLFDYSAPAELEKKLAVGQLLLVPFGHRQARGFVLELADGSAVGEARLKPVLSIVDDKDTYCVIGYETVVCGARGSTAYRIG